MVKIPLLSWRKVAKSCGQGQDFTGRCMQNCRLMGLVALAVLCRACAPQEEHTYGACLPLAGRVHKVWDNQECVGSAQAPRLWCVFWL